MNSSSSRQLVRRCSLASLAIGLALPVLAQHAHTHRAPPSHPTAATAANAPFAQRMDEAMEAMNSGMAAAPMNGDPDHDFAAMMIPHHQGAVDMAKAALLYGSNPVLKRLAQEIIVTQASEIAVMRAELDKPAAPSVSTSTSNR